MIAKLLSQNGSINRMSRGSLASFGLAKSLCACRLFLPHLDVMRYHRVAQVLSNAQSENPLVHYTTFLKYWIVIRFSTKFYRERLHPEVQPLTLLYAIFTTKVKVLLIMNKLPKKESCYFHARGVEGGKRSTPYNGLYGEAPPERGTFFGLQVYKRVGISQVEVYKRVGK